MTRECHVRFREGGGVRFPSATRRLAKALDPSPSADPDQSPTLTAAATQMGVIMGTAAYMSPEQAKGKAVDKRADIWAFGAVLFEMLTGKRAFAGEDVSDTLALVLMKEVDWTTLPIGTPRPLRRLLERCLERDPKRRLRDVGEARIGIDETSLAPSTETSPDVSIAAQPASWRRVVPFVVGALAVGSLATGLAAWYMARPTPPTLAQLEFTPARPIYISPTSVDLAITPDGGHVVYGVLDDELAGLHARPIGGVEAMPLVEGRFYIPDPFISPDGQWVGFGDLNSGTLRRVSLSGVSQETICVVEGGLLQGASWGTDDAIIFATTTLDTGLWRVDAAGGEASLLTIPAPERNELDHRWPDVLPGGQAVLFTTLSSLGDPLENAQIEVLSLETQERKTLIRGGTGARYVPTGHLVYGAGGGLRAVRFDLERLEVVGEPVQILEAVLTKDSGAVGFSVSASGSLVYLRGDAAAGSSMVWVDRTGDEEPVFELVDERLARPRLSPDDREAAFERGSENSTDVWRYDLDRGAQQRLTDDGAISDPVWTPDGNRLTFASTTSTSGGLELYWTPASGGGQLESLLRAGDTIQLPSPHAWSPDGRVLAFYVRGSQSAGGRDIWLLTRTDDGNWEPTPLVATRFNERSPIFSRDGQWLAYVSDESGRDEVYVMAYPDRGVRVPVSTNSGTEPTWSHDGRELFYREGIRMMAVSVSTSSEFQAGAPQELFAGGYSQEFGGSGSLGYDVAADGRFLMIKGTADSEENRIQVSLGWFSELQRLAPTN